MTAEHEAIMGCGQYYASFNLITGFDVLQDGDMRTLY